MESPTSKMIYLLTSLCIVTVLSFAGYVTLRINSASKDFKGGLYGYVDNEDRKFSEGASGRIGNEEKPLKLEVEDPTIDELNSNPKKELDELHPIIKDKVIIIHEALNLAVGYGRIPDEETFKILENKLEDLRSIIDKVTYEPLRKDISRGIKYLEYGVENKLREGIVSAHRVFHDLDAHAYMNSSDKTYFGSSTVVKIIRQLKLNE